MDDLVGPWRIRYTNDEDEGMRAAQRPSDPDDYTGWWPHVMERGKWGIWLPHSCDEWVIASGTREEVLAKAREFLASLVAAINVVEEGGQLDG